MIEKSKLGMFCFLASEALFFATLIMAYVYYRGSAADGPSAANSLEPATAGIYTALLLSSSLTMWRAEKSVERQRHGWLRLWLLATVVLGAAFLVGQGREYLRLIAQNVTIDRNLFGTTFFTLTGFHGLHVFSGLVALLVLFGLALAGDFKGPRAVGLEAVGWYWHFVDLVWIVIFGIVYLWPLL
jgi:heme/copper-type cytochrome/quinol oxidase subunit 3